MSDTSSPATYSELYTDLLNRVREQTGSSTNLTVAKRFINIGLVDMHIGNGEKFPWAERQAKLITQAQYTTGTVAINKGSTTLTGTSTAWDTNNDFSIKNARAGGKMVIDGGPEVYEVSSVDSDTSITLDAKWIDDDASGVSYVYFEDEYALDSDFLRPLDFENFDTRGEIELIDRKTFRERYPRNGTTGNPVVACIQDKPFSGDTTPVRKVRFWMPPKEAIIVPYAFVTNKLAINSSGTAQTSLSSDDDEPIVPLNFRTAIVLHGLNHYYRDRKDDTRADKVKEEYTDLMLRVIGDTEVGAKRPRFKPRVGAYKASARRPYRGRGGRRYSADSRFDQLRD